MARTPLTPEQREQGRAIGDFIADRCAKDARTNRAVARDADISEETLARITNGESAGVSFLVIGRLSAALGFPLAELYSAVIARKAVH